MKNSEYIEKVRVYRVVNGHVIQINLVGIDTEYTFVSGENDELGQEIAAAMAKVLKDKI